jgi:hypothetical protein
MVIYLAATSFLDSDSSLPLVYFVYLLIFYFNVSNTTMLLELVMNSHFYQIVSEDLLLWVFDRRLQGAQGQAGNFFRKCTKTK